MSISGPMQRWRLWRDVTAVDTDFATIKPSEVPVGPDVRAGFNGILCARDLEEICIRAFAVGNNAGTFNMRIYGLMDNGPLQKVSDIDCTLGTETFAEALLETGSVQAAGVTWRETSTYNENDDLVGGNAPTASTTRVTSFYRLPTVSLKYFYPKITAFVNVTRVALLWRPILPLR